MGQWTHMYKTKTWQALRKQQLQDKPLCAYCLQDGVVTPAAVVDHITPHKGDQHLFQDIDNLQSLCKLHHDSTKQREERRGVSQGCDEHGYPIDDDHHWKK